MIPTERFRFEHQQGENGENRQRNDFLDHLELEQRERSPVLAKTDPVRRSLKQVFQERNTPAEDDHQQKRQVVEPLMTLEPQLPVPGESHEYIGNNEQADCKIRFHCTQKQFRSAKITNYS